MGARLVSLVLARWSQLPDRAFRVAVRMALTALDEATETTPAGRYFGGRDALADVLRNERGGSRDTILRILRFAIDELIASGAVERVSAGRAGNNAVYQLNLLNTPQPIEKHRGKKPKQGESSVPPQEESHVPPQGESSVPDRGNAGFPPRNQEEPREEELEESRREVLPVVSEVVPTGGHAAPQTPWRPGDPSGHRTVSDISLSDSHSDPPQPETATHDRAREADTEPSRILRLIDGNPEAERTDDRAPLTPVPTRQGFGFCLECHAEGKTTLAVDQITGSACAFHIRSTA